MADPIDLNDCRARVLRGEVVDPATLHAAIMQIANLRGNTTLEEEAKPKRGKQPAAPIDVKSILDNF